MKRILVDERTEQINGLVSFFCLMITQIALVSVVAFKRYFMKLPPESYTEISWIAGLSMAGYWSIRLYLSGILPVLSLKRLLGIYIVLVALISILTYFIHGWPLKESWYEVLYPFVGVAIFLGFFSLVAYLGKRRIEQISSEKD